MKIGAFFSQIEAGIREKGMTIRSAMNNAVTHGITCLDVDADYFTRITPEKFAKEAKEVSMEIASVHSLAKIDVTSNKKITESIEKMKLDMLNAKKADSQFFMIVPQPAEAYEGEMYEKYTATVEKIFSILTAYGKEIGIQATVENFSLREIPYTSFEDITKLLEHNPDLMYTYDCGNFPLAGFDEIEGLKLFADRTVYVHLKDLELAEESTIFRNGKFYEGPAIDDGFVKNDEAFRYLAQKGYDGVFTMEICSLIDVYDKLLLSADRYMEKIRNLT
ncbi:MAG: sugar phosphate isomerase/epimerase [Clostridia bacterium]|nr:sugar phosphate isomerase/epimerase [Clostridia bacterium]